MKQDYFGISYCIDRELELQEQGENVTYIKSSSLSLSKSCDMRGCTRHYAGQRYQSVSLTADSEQMSLLFGSSGSVLWEQAIDRLDSATRQRYFWGCKPVRTCSTFLIVSIIAIAASRKNQKFFIMKVRSWN